MSEALFPVLHVLVGLPRAGKTTLANYVSKALGIPVVNLDDIHLKLFGTMFDPRYEPAVLRSGYSAIHKSIFIDGHTAVILDATNTTKARRDAFRSGVWVCHYHMVGTPLEVCIQRAHETGKSGLVPVIEEKHLNFESPIDDPSQGVKNLEKVSTVDMVSFEKDPTSVLEQFKQTITMSEARRALGYVEFMELPYGDKDTMAELVKLSVDLQFERDFVNTWTSPGKEPNPAMTNSDRIFEKQMAELRDDYAAYKLALDEALMAWVPDEMCFFEEHKLSPDEVRCVARDWYLANWCDVNGFDRPEVSQCNPFRISHRRRLEWNGKFGSGTISNQTEYENKCWSVILDFDRQWSNQPPKSVFQKRGTEWLAQALVDPTYRDADGAPFKSFTHGGEIGHPGMQSQPRITLLPPPLSTLNGIFENWVEGGHRSLSSREGDFPAEIGVILPTGKVSEPRFDQIQAIETPSVNQDWLWEFDQDRPYDPSSLTTHETQPLVVELDNVTNASAPATMDWFDQEFDETGRNWPIQPPDNVTKELTVTPAFPFTVIKPESVEIEMTTPETKIGRGLLKPILFVENSPYQETTMQTEETKPLLNLYVVRPFSNAGIMAKDRKEQRGTPYIDLGVLYGTWAKPEYIQKYPMCFDSCDGTTADIFMRYLFAIGEKEIDIVLPTNHTTWVTWFVNAAESYGANTNVMVVESDLRQSEQNAIKFLKDHGVEMDQERMSEWCCGALLTTDEIIEASLDPVTAFGPDITTPKSNRMKLFEALKEYEPAWLDLDLYMAARR